MKTNTCREAAPTKEKARGNGQVTTGQSSNREPKPTVSNDRFNQKVDNETTLGWSLFRDPLSLPFCIADIRSRLELKYCSCIALSGLNGHPVEPDCIQNPYLRSLGTIGRLLKNWNVQDLTEIHGLPSLTAEAVLITTLENPVWGADDVALFRAIEQIEAFQLRAERSGRTL
jgi:hypothetical protein